MFIFNIAGMVVSAFFIAFILLKKSHTRTDFWLVLLNMIMIAFLGLVIVASQTFTTITFFLQSQLPFYLFPVYILFAFSILSPKGNAPRVLLFAPAVLGSVCVAVDLFFLHDYNDLASLTKVYNDPPFFYHVIYKGNQIFFVGALIILLRKLSEYKLDIKNNFSSTDAINLNWLHNANWAYLVLTSISLITFLLANFKILSLDARTSFVIVSGCMTLVIFYLSFHGIKQYSIADYYGQRGSDLFDETSGEASASSEATEKHQMSSLSSNELNAIYQDLLKLFENESVFKESKLQLLDVADKIKVSPHTLSKTINTLAGKPFSDFVNSYRVKHMQKLLEDPSQKRFTILALGLESGFNSKASLNRVFKEQTNFSPSEYQRLQLRRSGV